ncbi:hypothetical protein LINPERPRIM_LOCUS14441 [Linum perenne]
MILRKWEKEIRPVDFSPRATPEWIEFQGVPPEVISNEGVSWLASKIGKPLNKFVRDGVNIRVCLLRDRAIPCPEKLVIEERYEVKIVQPRAREYGKMGGKIWRMKADPSATEKEQVQAEPAADKEKAADAAPQQGGAANPVSPIVLQIVISDDATPATNGTGGSKKKKRKKSKRKVSLEGDKDEGESNQISQSTLIPAQDIGSGNDFASSMKGIKPPADDISKQGTAGLVENPENTEGLVHEEEDDNEECVHPEPSGRKAQLKDYFPFSRDGPSRQKYNFSGVKTRHKTTQR